MAAALSTALQQCYASPLTSSSNTEHRIELIASSKLFAGLSRQCCERIAEQALPRTFDRDELLFMQGDSLRHVMLIRTGSVKITQLSASGNEVILWMYGRGSGMEIGNAAGLHARLRANQDQFQPNPLFAAE